ncbi:hypothetical protein BST27_15010 [Mycobacterium intermedium]|uniref:Serpin domain-containing protein n=1 Tax=Mycobacterium intermedium TaxID=28445 RepID=A0A1E3SEW6_MYCIE|nr:hypothetical protein [Mycobacterium intermedium]MCV6963113.1 hypothetical protein [Mycobacterium intermedium]ODR00704.1 hypothetical protein BHQ20_12005 [Mycobacterium intermedium]OPE52324.1 hypothetical protein BV508_02990 [Mycobacterium intermedium]ORB03651.1 hypothetical protein BST27_15010 [Mycobacterium intermedium]
MDVGALVVRYARNFCRLHAGTHSVSSPLGAWLILALTAPVARGAIRDELEGVLGTDAKRARRALDDLLADPPEAVRIALAMWGLDGWPDRLPAAVQAGPIPTQAQADAWARDHTDGLIDRFPVAVSGMAAVLASALATRISWLRPYDLADAADLASPWSAKVADVLTLHGAYGYLTEVADLGLVAVHTAFGSDSLQVTSVIARADAPSEAVLAAAHDIARRDANGSPVRRLGLSKLPLGQGDFWTITEERRPGGDQVRVVLPAWTASSDHDLSADRRLGFGAVARAIGAAVSVPPEVDARQSAVARYGQFGFEAAAVTAVALRSAMLPLGLSRTATLIFGHPYAVVAVTGGRHRRDPWAGVPVFAAWVSDPAEVSAVSTG